MSITAIRSLQCLHLDSDYLGLFSRAKTMPLDFYALLASPFETENTDKVFLKNLSNPSEEDLERVVELLNSDKYKKLRKEMCTLFQNLSESNIQKIIEKGLETALKKDGINIPVERYLSMPWEQFLENESDLETVYEYLKNLPKNENAGPNVNLLEETYRFICYIIDIMISMTSINYFLDDPGYLAHSESSKPYLYGIMITNLGALYALMLTIQNAALPAAGATVGTLFLLICTVKLYRKFLRPAEEMYPLVNLTREVEKGFSSKHNINQNVIDSIASDLRRGRPTFVKGPSGVGKTTHISALAEQLRDGKYPELQGKTVYYINTPSLLESGQKSYSTNSLADILLHLKGREDKVILFFDEAQAAWNEENQSLAEQFKGISDNFSVIFATTDREYEVICKRQGESFQALQRRAKLVQMSSQSDSETLAIMRKNADALFPELRLSNEELKLFLTVTKNIYPDRAQPEAALTYLRELFSFIKKSPELSPDIQTLKAELLLLRAEPTLENIAKIKAKEEELRKHEESGAKIKGSHKLFLDLLKDRKRLLDAQATMPLREWKFFKAHLAPALDQRIQTLRKEFFPKFMQKHFVENLINSF